MRRLRELFGRRLAVVGVHSAKFTAERDVDNLSRAVARLGIDHPVVADPGFDLWKAYAVRAWPTVVAIDRRGRVVAHRAGEIHAEEVAPLIEELLAEAGPADGTAAPGTPEPSEAVTTPEDDAPGDDAPHDAPPGPLRFPAGLWVEGDRLFVADTGHHRLIEAVLAPDRRRVRPVRVVGTGAPGLVDGAAGEARFHSPRGMARIGLALYVADTENHALRAVDLDGGRVVTVAGTGAKARTLGGAGRDATAVALRSPWDLAAVEDALLVAMAGSHQIWAFVPGHGIGVFAGTGGEALLDGPRDAAAFNQPSGLAVAEGRLYVADPEASAIRALGLVGDEGSDDELAVTTLVGRGLFEWGDRDGVGTEALLQHPTGITWAAGALWIADTYNHKIKRLDPATGQVETVAGDGTAGWRDGPAREARLRMPEALAADGDGLLVADTDNHRLRRLDPETGRLETLEWSGEIPDAPGS